MHTILFVELIHHLAVDVQALDKYLVFGKHKILIKHLHHNLLCIYFHYDINIALFKNIFFVTGESALCMLVWPKAMENCHLNQIKLLQMVYKI